MRERNGRRLRLVALLGGFAAIASSLSASSGTAVVPDDPDRVARFRVEGLERRIEAMVHGSHEEKLEAIDELGSLWRGVVDLEKPIALRLVRSLREWLEVETDEWARDRLLVALMSRDGLKDLYMDALASESTNLRYRAVLYFRNHRDPDAIEWIAMYWKNEKAPWILEQLIPALGDHWRHRGEELVPFIHSSHQGLAVAAIGEVGRCEVLAGLPQLIDLARDDKSAQRNSALSALAHFVDRVEVVTTLLSTSRDEDPVVRYVALAALARAPSPTVTRRLIEVASDSDEPKYLRRAALDGVLAREGPEVVALLHQIDRDTEEHESLKAAARRSLVSRGLLRPPNTVTEHLTLSCGNSASPWHTFQVFPPTDENSVRCWAEPGVAAADEARWRPTRGTWISIHDHFELEGRHWVGFYREEFCWTLRAYLERPNADRPEGEQEDRCAETLSDEWDLPVDVLDSRIGDTLLEEGLLEVIEADGRVAWVAVRLDPLDAEGGALLEAAYEEDDGPLSYAVENVVDAYDACSGD